MNDLSDLPTTSSLTNIDINNMNDVKHEEIIDGFAILTFKYIDDLKREFELRNSNLDNRNDKKRNNNNSSVKLKNRSISYQNDNCSVRSASSSTSSTTIKSTNNKRMQTKETPTKNYAKDLPPPPLQSQPLQIIETSEPIISEESEHELKHDTEIKAAIDVGNNEQDDEIEEGEIIQKTKNDDKKSVSSHDDDIYIEKTVLPSPSILKTNKSPVKLLETTTMSSIVTNIIDDAFKTDDNNKIQVNKYDVTSLIKSPKHNNNVHTTPSPNYSDSQKYNLLFHHQQQQQQQQQQHLKQHFDPNLFNKVFLDLYKQTPIPDQQRHPQDIQLMSIKNYKKEEMSPSNQLKTPPFTKKNSSSNLNQIDSYSNNNESILRDNQQTKNRNMLLQTKNTDNIASQIFNNYNIYQKSLNDSQFKLNLQQQQPPPPLISPHHVHNKSNNNNNIQQKPQFINQIPPSSSSSSSSSTTTSSSSDILMQTELNKRFFNNNINNTTNSTSMPNYLNTLTTDNKNILKHNTFMNDINLINAANYANKPISSSNSKPQITQSTSNIIDPTFNPFLAASNLLIQQPTPPQLSKSSSFNGDLLSFQASTPSRSHIQVPMVNNKTQNFKIKPQVKSIGKWCNAHARIAYMIYNDQQERKIQRANKQLVSPPQPHKSSSSSSSQHNKITVKSNLDMYNNGNSIHQQQQPQKRRHQDELHNSNNNTNIKQEKIAKQYHQSHSRSPPRQSTLPLPPKMHLLQPNYQPHQIQQLNDPYRLGLQQTQQQQQQQQQQLNLLSHLTNEQLRMKQQQKPPHLLNYPFLPIPPPPPSSSQTPNSFDFHLNDPLLTHQAQQYMQFPHHLIQPVPPQQQHKSNNKQPQSQPQHQQHLKKAPKNEYPHHQHHHQFIPINSNNTNNNNNNANKNFYLINESPPPPLPTLPQLPQQTSLHHLPIPNHLYANFPRPSTTQSTNNLYLGANGLILNPNTNPNNNPNPSAILLNHITQATT